MAIRAIYRGAARAGAAAGRANAAQIYVDSDDNLLKIVPDGEGTTTEYIIPYTTDATELTATAAEINRVADVSARIVTASGTSLTVAEATHESKTVLLSNVAGCAVSLPAATGGGARYRFVRSVALTSGSDVISAAASGLFAGYSIAEDSGDSTPADATVFATVNASTNTWTDAFTGGGGEVGDSFEAEDIATNRWAVKGFTQNILDSTTTPFSAV